MQYADWSSVLRYHQPDAEKILHRFQYVIFVRISLTTPALTVFTGIA
jgi:hypothetical protein